MASGVFSNSKYGEQGFTYIVDLVPPTSPIGASEDIGVPVASAKIALNFSRAAAADSSEQPAPLAAAAAADACTLALTMAAVVPSRIDDGFLPSSKEEQESFCAGAVWRRFCSS